MRQLLAIAWKDTYLRFSDRTQLIIMLATPLLLSTIIGMAFGGSSGGQITFSDIPLAIVNLDTGNDVTNLGDSFTAIFLPDDSVPTATNTAQCNAANSSGGQTLDDLFTTTRITDVEVARAGVEDGTYVAAIIIPADFTSKMSPNITPESATIEGAQIEVYANDGSPISASIVRSVATSIVDQFTIGNVTVAVTIGELINNAQSGNLQVIPALQNGDALDFTCAFVATDGNITVNQQPLDASQEQSNFVQILIFIGSAQAAYFALFTAQFGILSLFDEKETGTLQRMMVTPTSRTTIILGKMVGVLLSVILQLVLLLGSFTLIASLVDGQAMFIWGNNLLLLVILVLLTVLSISGVSIILVGLANSPEQVRVIGPLVNIGLGAMAGAFGFQLPEIISQFSPLYWSVNGFQSLAGGDNDIGLNLVILLLLGLATAMIGLWMVNRKVEV
ncbi:MAG: ABC transporter permease [Anaerolineae bacterium]|nr:ABC transporter permease [Anaerolineae bacterium]